MVYSLRNKFNEIFTIELSPHLHNTAKRRFSKIKNITFLQGDSGILLATLVNKLKEPAIFWLDGHYSGGITLKGESDTPA